MWEIKKPSTIKMSISPYEGEWYFGNKFHLPILASHSIRKGAVGEVKKSYALPKENTFARNVRETI